VRRVASLFPALVAAHVLANMIWIGALLAEAMLLGRARFMADGAEVGGLARRIHVRLAVPAFVTSFTFGLARFVMGIAAYAHMPWMHAKLTFALGVIVLHHILGARAKRAAAGTKGGSVTVLAALVFVCAGCAVFLAVVRPMP
jgi:putative membrane protein